ncbi:MAG: hypothetical protein ACKVP7_10545 [Hyphomicrobiaceae bacterium]
MSSPKTPLAAQNVVLPLSKPDTVNEVLVTELTGSQVIAGNLHMIFSVVRPTFTTNATGTTSVTLARVPSIDLVIPLIGVPDMAAQLRQIIAGMEMHATGSLPKPN